MLILLGLTDDDAPVAMINSALHKFDSYEKGEKGQASASGLAQASDAVPDVAAVGPVAKFLFSCKVGQALAKKALSVVEERKGEEELETTGAEVIEKQHGILAIANESINDFGPRLSEALCNAEEAYETYCNLAENGNRHGPKRRKSIKGQGVSALRGRVEASRDDLWGQVPVMFQNNAVQMADETIMQVNLAMENRGLVKISDTGAEGTLDLNAMMNTLQMPGVVSDLDAFQKDCKNEHVMSACRSINENLAVLGDLGNVVKTALACVFPTYQALYADQNTDANIKEAANFDLRRLDVLGVSSTSLQMLDASCLRHLKARREQLRSAVYVRVKEFVDMFLSDTHANVTLQTIQDSVLNEFAPDDPSTQLIMAYLRVIAHHRPIRLSELSSQDMKSIRENGEQFLQLWPLADCPEVVACGLARPEAKRALEEVLVSVKETSTSVCQNLVLNLTKLCKNAQARMKDLDPDDEDDFRERMQAISGKIAADQNAITKSIDQVVKAFKAQGMVFDQVAEHKALKAEAEKMSSMCMYYTCVFAALMFYNNRETWSTSKAGKDGKKNMMAALEALNKHPGMPDVEAHLNHQILAQMRTAVNRSH